MTKQSTCLYECHKDDALFCNKCSNDPTHMETIIRIHKKLLDLHGKEWYKKNTTTKYAYMNR